MKGIWCTAMLAGALAASGCLNQLHDEIEECKLHVRNHVLAQQAWDRVGECYGDVEHEHDFKWGFRNGYKAVAMGGAGCPPALPPRWYWGVMYQNPSGQAKQQAWFDGYEHGALAAEQEGVADFSRIMTSLPRHQALYSPPGEVIIHEGGPIPHDAVVPPEPAPLEIPPPQTHEPSLLRQETESAPLTPPVLRFGGEPTVFENAPIENAPIHEDDNQSGKARVSLADAAEGEASPPPAWAAKTPPVVPASVDGRNSRPAGPFAR